MEIHKTIGGSYIRWHSHTQAIQDFICTYVFELDDPITFQVRTRERHTRSSVSPLELSARRDTEIMRQRQGAVASVQSLEAGGSYNSSTFGIIR